MFFPRFGGKPVHRVSLPGHRLIKPTGQESMLRRKTRSDLSEYFLLDPSEALGDGRLVYSPGKRLISCFRDHRGESALELV